MSTFRYNLSKTVLESLLGDKSFANVPSVRYTEVNRRKDGSIALRLVSTNVVVFNADGSITLDNGGWQTVTTKRRINAALHGTPYRVWSDKGTWFVYLGGTKYAEFKNGIVLPVY